MAGIYIHIPFCRQKCYYCDFYKTVNTSLKQKFLSGLNEEAKLRKNYLENETIETIYFGGGTPSVLEPAELQNIFTSLHQNYPIAADAEITFEANPDDLNPEYLNALKSIGINRLSIGIQAFQNEQLKKMNRRHDAEQAEKVVKEAIRAGFSNLSVDLIYGLPDLTVEQWKDSLKRVIELPVHHLSAYHLTYHEGTPFYTWLKKGTLKELNEEDSVLQFNALTELTRAAGFEQYEISNFARDKMYSLHNSAYWLGKKYLGLGPSAHSYNRKKRRWNVAHVESYIHGISAGDSYFEEEQLGPREHYNEYILTRIRTKWGADLATVRKHFGKEFHDYLFKQIQKYLKAGTVVLNDGIVTIAPNGLLISDEIMSELMII